MKKQFIYLTAIVLIFAACSRDNFPEESEDANSEETNGSNSGEEMDYTDCGCNTDTPGWGNSLGTVSFRTNRTWKVGNQEWSDVVMAAACRGKKTFDGGDYYYDYEPQQDIFNYSADCRSNLEGYGDLFSWCAVVRFQKQLCPDGWRVPVVEDFSTLDKALGGTGSWQFNATHSNKYLNTWGVQYGGYASSGSLLNQGSGGYYWSQSENTADYGRYLYMLSGGSVFPQTSSLKDLGFTLRCVR